jgi:pimeloyl-ACP methyl ester carboxylesterase
MLYEERKERMPVLTVHGKQLSYHLAGEGFPLILVPDAGGVVQDWAAALPLLAELCRVIVYEYVQQQPVAHLPAASDDPVDDLVALLQALHIARAYVAGYAGGGDVALQLALRDPSRLEGLLLINPADPVVRHSQGRETPHPAGPPDAPPGPSVSSLSVPTLVMVGAAESERLAGMTWLTAQLPHCVHTVIQGAGVAPHREQPLLLGHAILAFLMQCERQRTLVRGASFLL